MFPVILTALGLKFLIFELAHYKHNRERIKAFHPLLKKLFSCPFCQGWWCGLLSCGIYGVDWRLAIAYGFATAWTALMATAVLDPVLLKWESTMPVGKGVEKPQVNEGKRQGVKGFLRIA